MILSHTFIRSFVPCCILLSTSTLISTSHCKVLEHVRTTNQPQPVRMNPNPNAPHQHVVHSIKISLPTADRPKHGFPTEPYSEDGVRKIYFRPKNEKAFVEGMRSVLRGVKRMKKETRDYCGLYGHLHYRDEDDWRRILAPQDEMLDKKMVKALLSRPPRVQCYCACFCP